MNIVRENELEASMHKSPGNRKTIYDILFEVLLIMEFIAIPKKSKYSTGLSNLLIKLLGQFVISSMPLRTIRK